MKFCQFSLLPEYYIISQESCGKPPPKCRDLLAVPPRHRSMGPLSVVLGGARPWWPYRLLDLLLVIITALMTGHTCMGQYRTYY